MGSQVTLVLVATSSGQLLAQEISTNGTYKSLVEGPDGVPKAVLGFNGIPVLNHWLKAIKDTPRLLPLVDKVFILCNDNNYGEVQAWATNPSLSAGGFPADNIFSIGAPDSNGAVEDVASFLAAAPRPGVIAIAEADSLMAPEFNLAKVVEAAVLRGRDTVTFSVLPRGAKLQGECVLALDDPSGTAPRVQSTEPSAASGTSDGSAAVLGPLVVLCADSAEQLPAAAASGGLPPGPGQLAHFIAGLAVAGIPVYGSPADCCFRLGTLAGLQLASNFFSYYLREKTGQKGEAAKALEAAKRLALLNDARARVGGSMTAAVKLLESEGKLKPVGAASGPASVREMWEDFWPGWQRGERQFEGERSGASRSPVYGSAPVGGPLPLRFADASTRRHLPRTQHPVYQTSNNLYGLKAPSQLDMPNMYAGGTQTFTGGFTGGPGKSSNLVTAVTRSKVHKALDDY